MTATRRTRRPRPCDKTATAETSAAAPDSAISVLPPPVPAVAEIIIPPQKYSATQKRLGIGEALRQRGLDEMGVAENLVAVVGNLKKKTIEGDSVEKLLVDVLKECSRHLEPSRPAGGGGAASVTVQLIHNIDRPSREKQ